MQIVPGSVYKFVFIESVPAGHPATPSDGTYKVIQEMTHDELRTNARIDTYPAATYADVVFYKIQSTDTSLIVYVPETYITGFPVVDVREYPKIVLTMNLGIVANPNILNSLQTEISSQFNSVLTQYKRWIFEEGAATYTTTVDGVAEEFTITVSDATGVVAGQAVDVHAVDGSGDYVYNVVPLQTEVESVDGNEITLTKALNASFTAGLIFTIDTATEASPLVTADACEFMQYDSKWLTEDEAMDEAATMFVGDPNPVLDRLQQDAIIANQQAQIAALEEIVATLTP
jgi:hypothetical protein